MATIQVKRGLESNIPQLLDGEPAFTTDTKKLFVGLGGENHLISGGGGDVNMVELTYQQLVALRNSSSLVKGTQYCITDYVTTTKNDVSASSGVLFKSARHQFDVIVFADNEYTLNENARARIVRGTTWYAWVKKGGEVFYTISPNPQVGDLLFNGKEYEVITYVEPGFVFTDGEETRRSPDNDRIVGNVAYFAWKRCNTPYGEVVYTTSQHPQVGDPVFVYDAGNDEMFNLNGWHISGYNGTFMEVSDIANEIVCSKVADAQELIIIQGNLAHQYFINNGAKVESWELKYCLDNDVNRFEWALDGNRGGKGVIYYMKDEHLNECNYDFKNIMYKVFSGYKYGCWKTKFDVGFPIEAVNKIATDPTGSEFVYTFFWRDSGSTIQDASVVYPRDASKDYDIMCNKISHQVLESVANMPNDFYTEKLSFLVFRNDNVCKNNVFTNCKYGYFYETEDVRMTNCDTIISNMVRNVELVNSEIFELSDVFNMKISGSIIGSTFSSVYDTTISGPVDYYRIDQLYNSNIVIGLRTVNCLTDVCAPSTPNFDGDQWIGFVCCGSGSNSAVKGIRFRGCKPELVEVT